ncbi:hypothetical protein EV189_0614 [Motilibacter rhizosphaerae]|uniref:Uncharacterized protein n=1 Tax=Motilibacter rhizosphaerae TaxID=598652 RepID=A0A4Q7NVS2_9ACTN|nr:hypothetical protein [Motilibacter rhizosphaerae]RZS91373.1 hypothetical protein EV189_0614 [Motilibacter rhizosphaerae]
MSTEPLLQRVFVSTGSRHLLVDAPVATAPPELWQVPPAPAAAYAARVALLRSGPVSAVAAAAAGDGWAHPLPWPGSTVADDIRTGRGLPDAEVLRALGALLAGVPDHLPTGDTEPPALVRVRARARELPGDLVGPVRDALELLADSARTAVHGQPALGHLVVPASGEPARQAVLTWWVGGTSAPAGWDLGHLLGDLLELAMLVAPGAPGTAAGLLAGSRAVVAGHGGTPPWYQVEAAALLKVVDHRLRLATLLGADSAPVRAADAVAATLLDSPLLASLRPTPSPDDPLEP